MSNALFILLGLLLCVFLVKGLVKKSGFIELPTIVAGFFALWVIPQLKILIDHAPQYLDHSLNALIVMVLLCFVATFWGWNWGQRSATQRGGSVPRDTISIEHYFLPALGLTIFVLIVRAAIGAQSQEVRDLTQWTGLITILVWLESVRIIPFVISLMLLLKKQTLGTVLLFAVNFYICGSIAVVYLRRSEMIDIGLAILGCLWFARRITLPRWALVSGALTMAAITFSIGEIRQASIALANDTGQQIGLLSPQVWARVDWDRAVMMGSDDGSIEQAPDFKNALFIVDFARTQNYYTFGAETWNGFVFQFVPAQFVGSNIKNELMIGTRMGIYDAMVEQSAFSLRTGTTTTGIGFAFMEFWYFGFFFFLLNGYFLGIRYGRAATGSVMAQIIYLSYLSMALISFTHSAYKLFITVPLFAAIFFALRLYFHNVAPQTGQQRDQPPPIANAHDRHWKARRVRGSRSR